MSEISRLEELNETINSLPNLTEKLHSWNKLIKDLNDGEIFALSFSFELLSKESSLFDLEMHLYEISSFRDMYKELFASLVKRLDIPIAALSEKIEELSNLDFKKKVQQFRINEEKRCTEYALSLAKGYREQFRQVGNNQWDYIRTCESMVTGFLFQPGIYPCSNAEERKLFWKEFEGFNPEYYCTVFRKKLKELFN